MNDKVEKERDRASETKPSFSNLLVNPSRTITYTKSGVLNSRTPREMDQVGSTFSKKWYNAPKAKAVKRP